VSIGSTAKIDASGISGGGAINIGGGFQGADPDLVNARTTSVDAGASITADAVRAGDGGTVVLWSDKTTQFAGSISARGGADAGQGGFVEVSGKRRLDFTGTVNLRAPMGRAGTLLLDPYNLTIASTGGNIAGTDATMDDSVLTVSALQSALDAGNVLVTTGSSGSQAGNITVANSISWLSENTLTLRAANDIAINANILGLTGSLVLHVSSSNAGGSTLTSVSCPAASCGSVRPKILRHASSASHQRTTASTTTRTIGCAQTAYRDARAAASKALRGT
jgi:hypothetical protein